MKCIRALYFLLAKFKIWGTLWGISEVLKKSEKMVLKKNQKIKLKNNNKMNKYTSLLVVALGLCAASAQANWVITAPNAAVVTFGQTGTSTYHYVPDTSGTIPAGAAGFSMFVIQTAPTTAFFPAAGGAGNPIQTFAVTSAPTTFTAGVGFDVSVSWTIESGITPPSPAYAFASNFSLPTSNGAQSSTQNFTIAPTGVPEPAQTVAGGMVLGLGGLAFASRRLLKKQTA